MVAYLWAFESQTAVWGRITALIIVYIILICAHKHVCFIYGIIIIYGIITACKTIICHCHIFHQQFVLIVGMWLKHFSLFPLSIQHKPTAPNDLRDPTKTKDTLHPTGWMGPQAPGGRFEHCLQILQLWQGRGAGADSAVRKLDLIRCNGGGAAEFGGFGDGLSLNNSGRDCTKSLINAEVVILVLFYWSLVI